MADAYYERSSTPIRVTFLCKTINTSTLLEIIIDTVKQYPELEQIRIEPYKDCIVQIRRLPDHMGKYKNWVFIPDKSGWVRKIDNDNFIEDFIIKKAKKLPRYKKNISDVRLLLVSDRTFNSGKMELEVNYRFSDTHGFNKVYYLSYPDKVFILE